MRVPTRGASRFVPVPAGPLGLVALAVGGLIVALALATASRNAPPPPEPAAGAVREGPLRLRLPPGWTTGGPRVAVPGMDFAHRIQIRSRVSGARVVAGMVAGSNEALLPEAFLREVQTELPEPEVTRIGERLEAFHYAGLTQPDVRGFIDVYAAPTTAGVATVACIADNVAALLDACWSVASTATLLRGRPLRATGTAALRLTLRDEIAELDAARATARHRLSAADTADAQAEAVLGLSAAFSRAAAAVEDVSSSDDAVKRDVLTELRRLRGGYEALARSFRRASARDLSSARAAIRRGESRLRRLLEPLVRLGPGLVPAAVAPLDALRHYAGDQG